MPALIVWLVYVVSHFSSWPFTDFNFSRDAAVPCARRGHLPQLSPNEFVPPPVGRKPEELVGSRDIHLRILTSVLSVFICAICG